jgi:hypothetical protein
MRKYLWIIVFLIVDGCTTDFTTINQAKNEVNKQGYREGRWVDFMDDNSLIINDTSKGYKYYMLSEFKDGKIISESKLYNSNGKLSQTRLPFEDDTNRFEKQINKSISFKKISYYNHKGIIENNIDLNEDNLIVGSSWYSVEEETLGQVLKSEKISYDSLKNKLILEGMLLNIKDKKENPYKIHFHSEEILSITNKYLKFKKIFEEKLNNEIIKKGFQESLIIKNDEAYSYPYQINFVVFNNDTLFVFDLWAKEAKSFLASERKKIRNLVRCENCGDSFNKNSGYVFNIQLTINYAKPYTLYYEMLNIMSSMGAVNKTQIESMNHYFCSPFCCNYQGYRVSNQF